jgi:ankyrin repeat protein
LAIDERHYGLDHPNVAIILTNLGNAYRSLGDTQKSRESLERALAINERYYGLDHPEVASTLSNLGNAYRSLGDFQKSRELLERALAIDERHYGLDHPEVAVTLTNLGCVYLSPMESQKSRGLLERSLTILENHFGPDNPNVTKTLEALQMVRIFENLLHLENRQETGRQPSVQPSSRLTEELFKTVKNGNSQKVIDLLHKTVNENAHNMLQQTTLHIAAGKGYENILRTLLENGANSGARDIIGWTPLHMAAANGHLKVVNALLENNADPTIRDKKEKTPLNLAEELKNKVQQSGMLGEVKNYQEIIDSLSKRVYELEQVQEQDLFNFVKKSRSELKALQKNKAYQIARIEICLKKGARIDSIDENHRTVLHYAAQNGRLEIVNFLPENGVDPTIKDKEENTSLNLAEERKNNAEQSGILEEVKNYQQIINSLSKKINELEKETKDLFNAAKQGDLQKVEECLRKGAHVNAQNTGHETPLHIAAEKGYKDVSEILLENGANIEMQDIIGWMPLHIAAANGHLEVVKVSLKRITDRNQFIKLNVGDDKVASLLQLAAQNHHLQIVDALLAKGASLGVVASIDSALLQHREGQI